MDRRARFEATTLPCLGSLYHVALRLTRREEDATDLVQDTYLRAYRGFDGFRPGTNCKAWMIKILYSAFVSRYRKQQREPDLVSIGDDLERYVDESSAMRLSEETSPDVARALDDLPPGFRAAVLLVDVEELSYEEAAAALDCPVGTLRSRLHRARKMLFGSLRDYAKKTGHLADPGLTE